VVEDAQGTSSTVEAGWEIVGERLTCWTVEGTRGTPLTV
jgi:hypothetical protein